jgi:hypothetical protein
MPRHDSPYIVGDYWLDKRRDGKSPDIWQIATGTRRVVYRSAHTRSLEEAKASIDAFHAEQQAKHPQEAREARVIPLLVTYWNERGKKAIKPDQIASSLRQFIGFLMQDEAGLNAVVTDLTPALFERFREWRMGPHEYSVPWGGKTHAHSSAGVKGESVQRNIDDVRAAILHAERNRRLPMAPKIGNLEKRWRSQSRDNLLTIEQLGAIYWYSRHFPEQFRYFALMLGTGSRPEAVAKFDPSRQFKGGLIDTQHPDAPLTNKRNQFIPAIRPLRPILNAWAAEGAKPAKSRKTAWRTMRRALGLPADTLAKDIRHTVATELYSDASVPERQTSELLGHAGNLARTTKIYAKYRPDRMREAERALSTLWLKVAKEARKLSAVQVLSKGSRGEQITVAPRGEKCKDLCGLWSGGR